MRGWELLDSFEAMTWLFPKLALIRLTDWRIWNAQTGFKTFQNPQLNLPH